GTAASDINAALAKAMSMTVAQVQAVLATETGEPDATEAALQSGLDALAAMSAAPAPAPAPQPSGDATAAIAAERRRVADITALATQHGLPDEHRNRLVN